MRTLISFMLVVLSLGCVEPPLEISSLESHVMGGSGEPDVNYPWVINTNFHRDCHGTLIDHQWVLTAAHCFYKAGGPDQLEDGLEVFYRRNGVESPRFTLLAEDLKRHDQFDAPDGTFGYDIGLIRLPNAFVEILEADPHVSPAELPMTYASIGEQGIVAAGPRGGGTIGVIPTTVIGGVPSPCSATGGVEFCGQSSTGCVVRGDSGSGLITITSNLRWVTGVAANASSPDNCTVGDDFTLGDPYAYRSWIRSHAPKAGVEPTADILWREYSTVAIWKMSAGAYAGATSMPASPEWVVVGTGDFNADGTTDILFRRSGGDLLIWLMREGQYIRSSGPMSSSGAYAVKAVADVDADGVSDIVFHNPSTRDVYVWIMNDQAALQAAGSVGISPVGWTIAGTGDFNLDERGDLLWTKKNSSAQTTDVAIWRLFGLSPALDLPIEKLGGNIPYAFNYQGLGNLYEPGPIHTIPNDAVWRDSNGNVFLWRFEGYQPLWWGGGPRVHMRLVFLGSAGTEWSLRAVGDVSADGISDLVWHRASDSYVVSWLITSGGGYGGGVTAGQSSSAWTIKGTGTFD